MHDTAMDFGRLFFNTYVENSRSVIIVDVGAQDVNGSLRAVAPMLCEYIGVDFTVEEERCSALRTESSLHYLRTHEYGCFAAGPG